MTTEELLASILDKLETLVEIAEKVQFLGQTAVCALAFLGAAAMLGGLLYARIDNNF